MYLWSDIELNRSEFCTQYVSLLCRLRCDTKPIYIYYFILIFSLILYIYKYELIFIGESTSKLVRTSASTSSLMGYRNDFSNITTEQINNCGDNIIDLTSKRSPRILITRTYSVESPDGNSPLLKKSCIVAGNSASKTNESECLIFYVLIY